MQTSPSMRRGEGRDTSRGRRRSPPSYESERKRYRARSRSPDPTSRRRSYSQRSWDREAYENSRRISSEHVGKRTSYNNSYRAGYHRSGGHSRQYDGYHGAPNGANGASGLQQPRSGVPMHQMAQQVSSKSRRLYIGNLPSHAGLTDIALTQFFSAMYVAAFRANRPGELLPVVSFWLHSDGKFGFMELRAEQEAVNMMQFNGVFLHGRPLRVNRPSDYRPEIHNPSGMNLVPEVVKIPAVMELWEKLGAVVAPPAKLAAIAASKANFDTIKKGSHQEPMGPRTTTPKESVPEDRSRAPVASHEVMPRKNEPGPTLKETEENLPHPLVNEDPTVISLKNLVTEEDLEADDEEYEEIVSDIEEECSKHGKVAGISIPKTGIWRGTAFVQFRDGSAAKNAMEALRKRVFDGHQIVAEGLQGIRTADEAASRPQKGTSRKN